jgi:hypothetical protein
MIKFGCVLFFGYFFQRKVKILRTKNGASNKEVASNIVHVRVIL